MQSVAGEIGVEMPLVASASADFTEIFREEFPRLAGYCAGLVGDRDLGGDLAQEAMARTWGRWTSVRDPHAYAFLVATNLAPARRTSRQLLRRPAGTIRQRLHEARRLLAIMLEDS